MIYLESVSEFHETLGDTTGQRKMPGAVEDGSFSTGSGHFTAVPVADRDGIL